MKPGYGFLLLSLLNYLFMTHLFYSTFIYCELQVIYCKKNYLSLYFSSICCGKSHLHSNSLIQYPALLSPAPASPQTAHKNRYPHTVLCKTASAKTDLHS